MKKFAMIAAMTILGLVLALPMIAGAKVLPPGSYRDSCKDCYVEDGRLNCRCRAGGGRWFDTSIRYYRCNGDIANQEGQLTCGGGGRDLPQGSWRDSCRRGRMKGNTLLAECKNSHGDWVQSWLDVGRCRGEVGNDNGRLVCGSGRSYRVPDGPWRQSCRRWRVEGDRMWAECRNRGGDWHGTWVTIRGCRTLTNDNGRLRCVR